MSKILKPTPATSAEPFRLAHGTGSEPRELIRDCLAQLGRLPAGANLGFIYASDALARDLEALLRLLKQGTGIESWVGSVGVAISVTGHEYYDQPALAVMVGSVPAQDMRLIPSLTTAPEGFRIQHDAWLSTGAPHFGIVHADPSNSATPRLLHQLAQEADAFLVGGITSSESESLQVSGEVARGGVSGVLFNNAVEVLTTASPMPRATSSPSSTTVPPWTYSRKTSARFSPRISTASPATSSRACPLPGQTPATTWCATWLASISDRSCSPLATT